MNPNTPYITDFYSDQNFSSTKDKEPSPPAKPVRPPLGFYEYRFYKSFGGSGMGHGYFEYPVDIDVDRDDNIYVCDRDAGRIQAFDSEGNFEEEWDRLDIEGDIPFGQKGSMDRPEALCVDYKDRIWKIVIYVADTRNNRILQFNKDGKLVDPNSGDEINEYEKEKINRWKDLTEKKVLLWGEFGSRQGQFHHPADIAVDGRGNCYILDSRNSRIQCFNDSGEFRHEWGGFGSGPGSFLKPIKLAYDQSGFGSIWVIDSKDGRLHQFDLDGNFIRALIPKDNGQKPLPKPTALCFDTQGFAYLTDSNLNMIFKYNNDLEFVQCWGKEGTGPGEFKGPAGIVVDKEDRVLVVDSGNSRVQIFTPFQTYN